MSGRSWRGCAGRTPGWRWSVMSSSAAWPSGSRTRWGGSGGCLDAAQREQDRIPHAASCRRWECRSPGSTRWRGGRPGPRAERRDRLKAEVARLFTLHEGKYGSPRISADLREEGWRVSENTVAALMGERAWRPGARTRAKATTRPGRGRWRAPDLVKRDFPARQLNRKWFGDGTQIATGEGKLHLVSVMDAASRRVLGFSLGEYHDAQRPTGRWRWPGSARRRRARRRLAHRSGQPSTPPGPPAAC